MAEHLVEYIIIPNEGNETGSLNVDAVIDVDGNTAPRTVPDGSLVGVPFPTVDHLSVVRLNQGRGYEIVPTAPGDVIVCLCSLADIPFQAAAEVRVTRDGRAARPNQWWALAAAAPPVE